MLTMRQAVGGFSAFPCFTLKALRRPFSSTNEAELKGYEKLRESSGQEIFNRIVKAYSLEQQIPLCPIDKKVQRKDLLGLIEKVRRVASIPIMEMGDLHEKAEFLHFKENTTFINLPYSDKVNEWSDRTALQDLIRSKFPKLFRENDLVIVPGCADGQIPIEVYANAAKHGFELDIVAADYNLAAMQLGHLTMNSFGLRGKKLRWIQTDVKSKRFFDWIKSNFSGNTSHQIVTLVQPSLGEENFLSLLKRISDLHKAKHLPTSVVMPILLEDESSEWYKTCNSFVQEAADYSKTARDLQQMVWKETEYGHEMLRLSSDKKSYLAQQYFIKQEALPEIRRKMGYENSHEEPFDKTESGDIYIKERAIRALCRWDAID